MPLNHLVVAGNSNVVRVKGEKLSLRGRSADSTEAAPAAALPAEAGGVGATADLEASTRKEESRREYATLEAPRHLFGGGAAVSRGRIPAEKRKQRGRRREKGDAFVGREDSTEKVAEVLLLRFPRFSDLGFKS